MAYLFDFDGVLVDSMPTWAGVYIDLLKEYEIPFPKDIVKRITPLGNAGAADFCIDLGLPMTRDDIAEHNALIYTQKYFYEIPAKKGVLNTLKRLKDRGISLNVLTASPHRFVDPCLKRNGLYHLFDNVWTIDDFGHKKDEIVIYEMAAERLCKAPNECTFFDDNLIAATTAKSAGMVTVGVFDNSAADMIDKMKASCDRYIKSFEELE